MSLRMLIVNCALGMVLICWMALTLWPFLLGFQPLLPGMDLAFIGSCMWAGWNARYIIRTNP